MDPANLLTFSELKVELNAAIMELDVMGEIVARQRGQVAERDAENKRLREALQEISLGKGVYSRDLLTHAFNVIDNMKELARAALSGEKVENNNG